MAIASLKVLLEAVTGKFDKNMKKSSKRVAKFRASVGTAAKGVAAFGAASAVAAAAGVAALTSKGLAAVDAQAKLADRLGVTVESLAGFQLAAQIGGASSEDVTKGIERMTRSLGEAGQGLSTPLRGLETLGLKLEDIKTLRPDEQFRTIAEAIKGIQDPADRATASYAIFGRQGHPSQHARRSENLADEDRAYRRRRRKARRKKKKITSNHTGFFPENNQV